MKQFCRTCGKTIVAHRCIQIFSPEGRKLLQCVRSITNCWLQNSQDLPNHMCPDCQMLLKQVQKFRRRCAKIEKYFNRRRSRMNLGEAPAAVALQLPVQQTVAPDPLGIDELMAASEIKLEPSQVQVEQETESLYAVNQLEVGTSYEESPSEDFLPLPEDYGEAQTEIVATTTNKPEQARIKTKIKSSKHTMRMGRKLIHVKVIDDKQPKRIVDRNGQNAKPCICEHCGRQFKDTSNLNVHLLRHTGTKPFECEQCHQKCYTLHLLRRHQLKHTEGPYACTFCGLEYSTNSSRVRHEREACKKGRAPQSKWEIIKKGERTFHCEVCDLWFLRAGNFTQHINSSSHIENERRKKRKTKSVQPSAINT
ncbi:zinc finger protein 564 [Drosophila eugracilis]|uniref:zinc finger protein 564 n=1 Tax=Drosophila eugracilis TaxID=29029 RepID=UPI0007E793D5|nr:zinc finger protein 564 [Drosophila eugracilis]